MVVVDGQNENVTNQELKQIMILQWINLKSVCRFSLVLNVKWKFACNIWKVRDHKVDFSFFEWLLLDPIVWVSEMYEK